MDSQRLVLFFVFTMSVFLLYESWQRDQQSASRAPAVVAATPTPSSTQAPQAADPAIPTPAATLAPTPAPAAPTAATASDGGQLIRVETDLYRAQISTVGGDLVRLELLKHGGTLDRTREFVLFERSSEHVYIAQSGLIGKGLPNHQSLYRAAATEYRLADTANELEIRLESVGDVKAAKVYRFRRDSYVIDVKHEITNTTAESVPTHAYFQLVRDSKPPEGDSAMMPTYTGAAVYTDKDKFQKVSFDDIEKGKAPYPKTANDGWIGMLQHYFLGAWLPRDGEPREYYTRQVPQGLYAAGVIVPGGTLAPGASAALSMPLYAGPQEQEKLAALAKGLDLAVDYGWLTVIAAPLFWVLQWIHGWAGNWGVAIIILTILIKLIFYPLSEASYRSMAKMRVVAPKMQRLKEQYGNDRQRMQQAMMELYKTEKINPLGGCLPILVQIPVFIALYWVLLASVEMRQAPFALWITDLSVPDPWFILPILMGATMIIQTRLNPEPPDPVQAKVMKIMPIAFSIFFFFFPAGLVLYWLVNNILSIAQQWHINRVLERAAKQSKPKS
ncbi:MAG: membrane protein insertase YidC [Burkholderiales bacterium]|jgi:YidC/Oxa1 family membrane protein insertase|nr:membrane protein insertase YidC [Burkholderiales bacterium]